MYKPDNPDSLAALKKFTKVKIENDRLGAALRLDANDSDIAGEALASPAALALLKQTGRPVAGPSANRSGQVTATTAAHVAESLGGKLDFILDAGSYPGPELHAK